MKGIFSSDSVRRGILWLAILACWEGAYRIVQWRSDVFPAPSHILDAAANLLETPLYLSEPLHAGWPWRSMYGPPPPPSGLALWQRPLVQAPLISGARLLIGFAVSIFIGCLLGLALWRWKQVDGMLGPLFLGLQTLPSVCWAPLAVVVVGLDEWGILFVLVMGSCFAVAISLRDGLRSMPPVYQRAGRMLGAGGWRLYRYVLLPASLPALTSSLRQGFSFAWRSLMGAELILMAVDRHGLGYLLEMGRNLSDVRQVVAIMILMILLGMIADRYVFAVLEKRVHARFGLAGQ